jgi:hypothetical protein
MPRLRRQFLPDFLGVPRPPSLARLTVDQNRTGEPGGRQRISAPRARARDFVTDKEYREFAAQYIEVQKIYRRCSTDSAVEICRLSVEAENEHVRAVCGQMVLERAWGKPKEYDPNAEQPQQKQTFDLDLYTIGELEQLQKAILLMARRQGPAAGGGG